MTKPESFGDEPEFSHKRYWTHLVVWSACITYPLIALPLSIVAMLDYVEEGSVTDLWVALILCSTGFIAGYFLWRTAPDLTMGEPRTPRGNRLRWMLWVMVILGIATSIPIITADPDMGGAKLWSNSPMPPVPALIACALWGIALPVFTVMFRGTADEHKQAAQDFGMMVGGQMFTIVTPVWWMGWRGGFVPEPDAMLLFVFILVVTWIANIWKQYA